MVCAPLVKVAEVLSTLTGAFGSDADCARELRAKTPRPTNPMQKLMLFLIMFFLFVQRFRFGWRHILKGANRTNPVKAILMRDDLGLLPHM